MSIPKNRVRALTAFVVVAGLAIAGCTTGGSAGGSASATTSGAATSAPAFTAPAQVEFVVHSAPGGGMDLAGREWVAALQTEKLVEGSTWTVSNQTGGGGAAAMAYIAQREGKTDMVSGMTTAWITAPLLTADLAVTVKNFTPIVQLVSEPAIVVVKADSPYNKFEDIIAAAKASPGTLIQAGGIVTSVDNVAKMIIEKEEGVSWKYLNLEDSGARIIALMNGDAHFFFAQPQEAAEYIRAGQVKAIATVSDERMATYPDVPLMSESGIETEIPLQMRAILGPPNMPQEAVDYYIDVFKKLVETTAWKNYIDTYQLKSEFISGDEFGAKLAEQVDTFTTLFKGINLEG